MFQAFYSSGPNGLWIFLLVTLMMGGGTAYVSGRAIADTWRPFWQVIFYGILLALTVRFLHFALFEEVLLSAKNLAVDAAVTIFGGVIGYLVARRRQMAAKYNWTRPAP